MCPWGQVRNEQGTCLHPSSSWVTDGFVVPLKLTPYSPLFAKDIPWHMSSTYFRGPWPNSWDIVGIFVTFDDWRAGKYDPNNMVINFIVLGLCNQRKTSPELFLPQLYLKVFADWTVGLKSGFALTYSSILEYEVHTTKIDGRWYLVPKWSIYSGNDYLSLQSHVISDFIEFDPYATARFNSKFSITILLWCEQIMLSVNDFKVLMHGQMLVYEPLNKILNVHEFSLLHDRLGYIEDSAKVIVCARDVGYYSESIRSRMSPTHTQTLLGKCIYLLLVKCSVQMFIVS